ncbi:hypothetical protein OG194_33865 [Streptomyces sp. NBC_01288]|uniref:hypothetical protein n=1 Tax=Streptomyces sp. NBC_01288 TaxID=2903814 RepID=UPI002E1077EA|nr:hypothetical protein OG194_33865 [Streptomyces sp. NBC_01288]
MGLGTTTAHADPGIPDVGYGHANNPDSVGCAQSFVNNYHWDTTQSAVNGILGKNTGGVVLKHIKRYPLSIDYRKASRRAHEVPSYGVILN